MTQDGKESDRTQTVTDMQFTASLPFGLGSIAGTADQWRRLIKWLFPKLALIVAGGALTFSGLWLTGILNTHAGPQVKVMADFHFVEQRNAVPFCAVYNGAGTIPAEDAVLIFDQSLMNNNQPEAVQAFSLDGEAIPDGTGWYTPKTLLGDPGEGGPHIELLAVLVPKTLANYFESIILSPPYKVHNKVVGPWWKSTIALPGLQSTHIDVTRSPDNGCWKPPRSS